MTKNLSNKVQPVKSETLDERIVYCATTLHIHGYLTDSERLKIHRRLMKRRDKEAKESK